MPSEADIEKKIVKFCREHGIYTRKFASPANRGVPDRIFCKNGKVLFLELKRPGNKPTALQERELALLNSHGMTAGWADTYPMAVGIIEHTFSPANLI